MPLAGNWRRWRLALLNTYTPQELAGAVGPNNAGDAAPLVPPTNCPIASPVESAT